MRLLILCTKNIINSIRLLSYYRQVRAAKLRKWWFDLRKREGNRFGARSIFWEIREPNSKHESVTQHSMQALEPREMGMKRQMRGSGREQKALYTHPRICTLGYPCGFLFQSLTTIIIILIVPNFVYNVDSMQLPRLVWKSNHIFFLLLDLLW